MAYDTTWQSLIDVAKRYGKGIPLTQVTPQIADFCSSEMYVEYPWKQTITNTANSAIPLIDSTQDYTCAAPNIFRPLKAALVRTDIQPNYVRDLNIEKDLSVDLFPRSYNAIRAMSLQQAIGLFRLDSAVNIPTGMQVELRVDYQINPEKVVDLNQTCWFDTRYAFVALEGLLYYVYKLSDDQRAGTATTDAFGRVTGYTGQLGTFKAALTRMKSAEELGFTESVFPGEPMGLPRDVNSMNIFGN